MSDGWAVVAAGLGGAAITGIVSLLIVERQAVHQSHGQRRQDQRNAYAGLLSHSALILHNVHAMHTAMAVRSGLVEGVNVTVGVREAMDPLKLWESLRADWGPLIVAWSEMWAVGTPSAVTAANELMEHCSAVMATGTVRGEGRTRIERAILGEKWTKEQLDAWDEDVREVAAARRALAMLARQELGSEATELFSA